MRTFAEIQDALGLKRFLRSDQGTLYFIPTGVNTARMIVRHFDGELSPEMIVPYIEIIRCCQEWIERHPDVAYYVRVNQPLEVGIDFVARDHPIYLYSTSSYLQPERSQPRAPSSLNKLRDAFRQAMGQSDNPHDAIIEDVLSRSILEPSGKTYPGAKTPDGKIAFIVVEPHLQREDVEKWMAEKI